MKLEGVVEGSLEHFKALTMRSRFDDAKNAGCELYFLLLSEYDQMISEISSDRNPSFAKPAVELITNSVDSVILKWRRNPEYVAKIMITLEYDGSKVKISVDDNGIGLDDWVEGQMFDSLFTTKDPETFIDGFGLGLSKLKKELSGKGKQIGYTKKEVGVVFWYEVPVE
jgi:sensor histidine kinase regulating citrate/malate metabolism